MLLCMKHMVFSCILYVISDADDILMCALNQLFIYFCLFTYSQHQSPLTHKKIITYFFYQIKKIHHIRVQSHAPLWVFAQFNFTKKSFVDIHNQMSPSLIAKKINQKIPLKFVYLINHTCIVLKWKKLSK